MSGIVYCLTNEAMPEYVKIGMTEDTLEQRLNQLDNTSTPLPFECVYAIEVDDPRKTERLLHQAFHDKRTRSKREFFEVGQQQVVAAMQLTGGKDVTPGAITVQDEESQRAVEKAKTRRANFNFEMVGLAAGTELYFWDDPDITCSVHSRNRVLFEGEEASVSAAAGEVLARRGKAAGVNGTLYWYYEDESLYQRRTRMESQE